VIPKLGRALPAIVVLASLSVLAACGSSSATTGTTPADQANTQAGAEAGAGTETSIAYTDSVHHYRISGPGRMTANPDGTSSFIGPVERLEVAIVDGTRAADPMALASADLNALKTTAADFRQVQAPTVVTVSGHRTVKFVYQWTAGTNAVTGKANQLITARYYITKDSGRLAMVSYASAVNQYDPQGADDVANTFAWLP
jgi:hypothetical protein